MKKNQAKTKQQPKTKIELKIKSKNVTNNFILTPRTPSVLDQKDNSHRFQKATEEMKSEKQRRDECVTQKSNKDSKKPEYRVVFTDHPKTTIKRKYEEDQTGTHTPLLKRVSNNSEIGNKKKSTHSLINADRSKQRRKASSRMSNSTSGEINKTTLQRLIGVIIKDYREGKLKQRELEQTLMELYDQKERKKSVGKTKKKKDVGYNTFSNDFAKSSHQIRSQALVRRRKKSDQIYQKVLQRKGFVNKIIIKGITTSLFLKEEPQFPIVKQNQAKLKINEPSYQINTENSVKQIYEDMINVKKNMHLLDKNMKMSLKEMMAIKIQRAWRRYKTRKLLCTVAFKKRQARDVQPMHILDEFTDEENDQPYYDGRFTRNLVRPDQFDTQSKQYSELVNLISESLQEKKLSKDQCLKKILLFLKYPQDLIASCQKSQKSDLKGLASESDKQLSMFLNSPPASQEQEGKQSRIIFNPPQQGHFQQKEENFEDLSNELGSFTNKYSSKEVNNDNKQMFMAEQDNTQQLDESLTFVHSQTLGHESFKMINIQNIEEGLKGREESLQLRKEKELEDLTETFFTNKIGKQEYLNEKAKIEKWFRSKQKQLKKIKNTLLKSCLEAKNILENDSQVLTSQKSKKMLKCLSDKYIKKQDWLARQQKIEEKKAKKKIKHLQCQENEDDSLRMTVLPDEIYEKADLEEPNFTKKEAYEGEWQNKRQYQLSPKLSRHTSLDDNEYKYEQVEKIIEQDDEGFEEMSSKTENKQLQSDKFINLAQQQEQEISAEEISLIHNYIDQNTKKFKYLCTEDKQDIFEFLFLDLVLEMFTELYPGQSKILRTAQIYIHRARRLKKIPKGIKTNLISCKEYLRVLTDYVNRQPNALKVLSQPMGPSASEMLRYMRDEIVQTSQDDCSSLTLVLPVQFFQRLGKSKQLQLKLQRYYQDEEKESARISFLRTALHINNKALFDSLNEMLDHQRPYGVWGKPFPWKKALSLDKKWTKIEQQKKLKASVDKTIECCSYLCGILVDKQDSLFGNHRVSQQYITQIRQDRLSKMLANDLIQNEERWIFYDDQETEILMQASAYVTKKLIKELVLELVTIKSYF